MVVIRLSRTGAKKRPFYHVVVANKAARRDGRNIEQIGYFNPIARGQEIWLKLDIDKVNEWVGKGAQLSDRVKRLVDDFKAHNGERPPKRVRRKAEPVVAAEVAAAVEESAAE